MRNRRPTTISSAALALGLLGCVAPAAASVPAFVAPWAVAVGVGGQGISAAATALRAAAAETAPPPTYPPADGPTSDTFSPAAPPQDLVCQTIPPTPTDTHDVSVRHYE